MIPVRYLPVAIAIGTFLGSGTTAIACKNLNRKFKGCEISKEYYEKIKKECLEMSDNHQ